MKTIYALRYIFYLIIIIVVSTYLILLSYGYKINWQAKKLQKTSIIYLAGLPRDVYVSINNKVISDSTPIRYTGIFPGRYDVKVENNDYNLWEKTMYAVPDLISQDADIILILKDIKKINLTSAEEENYQKTFQDREKITKESKNIFLANNNEEIYFGDIYITRLSQPIKNIVWYADKKHLIYQVDNKIYFMDSDGSNIQLLIQLSGDKVAQFFSTSDGKYLVYKYEDEITRVQITNISNIFTEKYFNQAVKIIK